MTSPDPETDETPLLSVRDLVTTFPLGRNIVGRPRGEVQAVAGVSFDVWPGETLGLVGESGCGKSTLARTVVGLTTPRSGTITFAGRPIDRHRRNGSGRGVTRDIQMVFQDPFSSLNQRMTVTELISEPWLVHPGLLARDRWPARVAELLEMVGLSPRHAELRPDQFSGGQLQRISIARALAMQPRLLIADEAVSALDVSVQAQILNLLSDLRRDLGLAIVFISHDLSVVRHLCDRVAVMYLGTIVEIGDRTQVYEHPTHPYTQGLLGSVPDLYPWRTERPVRQLSEGEIPSPADPPSGCRFRTRCPKVQDLCSKDVPALEPRGFDHPSACHFAADDAVTASR